MTKKPLKNIEKPAGASTWVFVNQYTKGHKGILNPKPIESKRYINQISSVEKLNSRILENKVAPLTYIK